MGTRLFVVIQISKCDGVVYNMMHSRSSYVYSRWEEHWHRLVCHVRQLAHSRGQSATPTLRGVFQDMLTAALHLRRRGSGVGVGGEVGGSQS